MTHVFVVDNNTFKYHLEYMFAGTGSKDDLSLFLTNSLDATTHHTTERKLVGMIADISRINIGDNVVFYLQANGNIEGSFYGVFKVKSEPFFDENNNSNYLKKDMKKGLSFRVLIEPGTVYPKGVTEHEFLDSLEGKIIPQDLIWSLIYRKLEGNRGCTMIMDFEFESLLSKLKKNNVNGPLKNGCFTFNQQNSEISNSDVMKLYIGNKQKMDIFPRLMHKINQNKAFETHLQSFVLQNIHQDKTLMKHLLSKNAINLWLGNEVICGVGAQRIDLLIIEEQLDELLFKIIELKDEPPQPEIINQMEWYLKWLIDYIIPKFDEKNKNLKIIPTIIARGDLSPNLVSELNRNFILSRKIEKTQYIGFSIQNQSLKFTKNNF